MRWVLWHSNQIGLSRFLRETESVSLLTLRNGVWIRNILQVLLLILMPAAATKFNTANTEGIEQASAAVLYWILLSWPWWPEELFVFQLHIPSQLPSLDPPSLPPSFPLHKFLSSNFAQPHLDCLSCLKYICSQHHFGNFFCKFIFFKSLMYSG